MLNFDKESILEYSKVGCSGVLALASNYLASIDDRYTVIVSDILHHSGLVNIDEKYKDRVINVGIAEQNEIGVATGLVNEGFEVYASVYTGFAVARALDQIKVSMGYMQMPIKIIAFDSGFNDSSLGPTHTATSDLSILRAIPNITILSPCDATEFMKMLLALHKYDKPAYIAIKIFCVPNVPMIYDKDYDYKIGKANTVYGNENTDITFFATGYMVYKSIEASKILEKSGIKCKVVNIHTIKPFDNEIIKENINSKMFVTVEENNIIGGIGSLILEEMSNLNIYKKVCRIAVEDFYPKAGRYDDVLAHTGLDLDTIVRRVNDAFKEVQSGK